MPVVLFVWGAFRIVPVRVTGLTITEKLYDEMLNPVHAEAQLQLRVLTPAELQAARESNEVLARSRHRRLHVHARRPAGRRPRQPRQRRRWRSLGIC